MRNKKPIKLTESALRSLIENEMRRAFGGNRRRINEADENGGGVNYKVIFDDVINYATQELTKYRQQARNSGDNQYLEGAIDVLEDVLGYAGEVEEDNYNLFGQ